MYYLSVYVGALITFILISAKKNSTMKLYVTIVVNKITINLIFQ